MGSTVWLAFTRCQYTLSRDQFPPFFGLRQKGSLVKWGPGRELPWRAQIYCGSDSHTAPTITRILSVVVLHSASPSSRASARIKKIARPPLYPSTAISKEPANSLDAICSRLHPKERPLPAAFTILSLNFHCAWSSRFSHCTLSPNRRDPPHARPPQHASDLARAAVLVERDETSVLFRPPASRCLDALDLAALYRRLASSTRFPR